MKATLNKQPYNVPAGCDTLGDLLDDMQQSVPRGHVVFRILVDGRELDDEGGDVLDTPCAGIAEVEIFSARALDLAREGLEQAVHILPQLTDALRGSATHLRRGDTAMGLDQLFEALSQVEWYTGLIAALDIYFSEMVPGFDDETDADDLAASLGDGLDPRLPDLRTFASVENLRARLIEVQQLQRADNYGGLADLLEHELLPLSKLWQREAPELLRRINREGAQA